MDAKTICQQVFGWLDDAEAELLYNLAGQVSDGYIVEIGSHHGRSTICMAAGVKAAGKHTPIYAVDPHVSCNNVTIGDADRAAFLKNLVDFGVADIVRVMDINSVLAVDILDGNIGLLFIDGDHDYHNVSRDFSLWRELVLPAGYIILHDSAWPGPAHVIAEVVAGGEYDVVGGEDATTVLRATRPLF